MVDNKAIKKYEELVAAHDFTYMMSDDHRAYMAGHNSHTQILALETALHLDGVKTNVMSAIWNKYAPDRFKVQYVCDTCEARTYKLHDHPDPNENKLVCEDCEYKITETLSNRTQEPIENYKDIRGE